MVAGVEGGLGPIGRAGFVEDVADVAAHRIEADHQFVGNLLIAFSSRNETEDLQFTTGKTIGIGADAEQGGGVSMRAGTYTASSSGYPNHFSRPPR